MKSILKLACAAGLALAPLSASASTFLADNGYALEGTTLTTDALISIDPGFAIADPNSLTAFDSGSLSSVFGADVNDASKYGFLFVDLSTGESLSSGLLSPAIDIEFEAAADPFSSGFVRAIFEGIVATGVLAGVWNGEAVQVTVGGPGMAAPSTYGTLFPESGYIEVALLEKVVVGDIPLPAGAWLLLTGAGALVVTRRRKAA